MLTNRRAREDRNSNREMQGSRGRWLELWWVKRERPIKGRSQCKEYLSFWSLLSSLLLAQPVTDSELFVSPKKDIIPALHCPGLQGLDCTRFLLLPWDHQEVFSHPGIPTAGVCLPLEEWGWKLCFSSWHGFGVSLLLCSWRMGFQIWSDIWCWWWIDLSHIPGSSREMGLVAGKKGLKIQ